MKPPDACYYLSNKAYFFTRPEPVKGDDHDPEPQPLSTPFWCLRTHETLGPDGEEACDEFCGPARSCYQPEVEL